MTRTATALQLRVAQVSRQQLETITRYLLFKNVPHSLTCQIIDYLEYKMMSTKTMMQLADFKQLPHEMRLMLTVQLNRQLVHRQTIKLCNSVTSACNL